MCAFFFLLFFKKQACRLILEYCVSVCVALSKRMQSVKVVSIFAFQLFSIFFCFGNSISKGCSIVNYRTLYFRVTNQGD